MKLSRLAVFSGPGQLLSVETTAVPALGEGEILVRNEYTTLCRSDLNTYSGKRTEPTPTILGHEIVGRIEELGPEAPTKDLRGAALQPGQRVTWAIYASNPAEALSRAGIPQKAPGLFKYGHELLTPNSTLHGGLAEYCVLRRHTPILGLDTCIPLPVAALINCSVATVAGSIRLAGPLTDRDVVVAGAGMLGVVACALARIAGARRIVAVDVEDSRLDMAGRFGADLKVKCQAGGPLLSQMVHAVLANEPASLALDYSGVPGTMEGMLGALGIGGTAVFVGATFPQRTLQISAEQLIRRVLTVKGLHNYNEQDLITAVAFMEKHHQQFPFSSLVEDRFTLDTVNDAFNYGLRSGAYRVGIALTESHRVSHHPDEDKASAIFG